MKVLDPGHRYLLAHLDGVGETSLVFVKRVGEKYPGNTGAHEGTTMQEVLRALIDRSKFVDAQESSTWNAQVLGSLRRALWALECRAAAKRGEADRFADATAAEIESLPTCATCGHVACGVHA